MNDTNVIEAKFKRCPKCRSYSVEQTETGLNSSEKLKGFLFHVVAYYCDNCSYRYIEYDNFFKTLKNRLPQKKRYLTVLLVLAAILIIILVLPEDKSPQLPPSTSTLETLLQKREVHPELASPIETKKTIEKTAKEETEPISIQERIVATPEAATSPAVLNKRSSIMVFPATTIKIRVSARNSVGPPNRWSFLKKTITVIREAHQSVYVAGDSEGSQKWAVDDQLIINGKVFKGLSTSYDIEAGYLPEIAKNLPLDITNLVPPDQEASLEIKLVDHGKLWANTEIHIVVK